MYIVKQADFEKFLEYVSNQDAVAIDTEFIREKTYWPKLCLLQMCAGEKFALVDPFTVDITSISKILGNKNIVKVFHAPRQDIEILYHKTQIMPEPIFDTQTAASFLGSSIQIGYGNLVHSELGIKLNKSDSYTDWSARPLTNSQKKYAKEDVTYLLQLYYKMYSELKQLNRLRWVEEDTSKYLDPKTYEVDPQKCFRNLKRISSLSPKQLGAAQNVAAWREKKALEKNMPRRWIMADEVIIEAVRKAPKNINQLFLLRGIKSHISTADARIIVDGIKKGLKLPKQDWPSLSDKDIHWNDKSLPDCGIDGVIDVMCSLVRLRARQNNIAPQTLSTNRDLSMIAHGMYDDVQTLKGWRKNIVGDELLDLLNNKISISIKDNEIHVREMRNKGNCCK